MRIKKMRAFIAYLLIATLLLSACGRKREAAEGDIPIEAPIETAVPVETVEPTPEPTAEPDLESKEQVSASRRIDPDGKMIALTFDDGPGAGTRRILNALDEVDGRATFCMVANRLNEYAQTARKVAEQGSEIATHTWDHPNLTKLGASEMRKELSRSLNAIEETTGVRPTVLRPPYGSVNSAVREACAEMGLVIANWNIDPEDWKTRNAASIRSHILNNAKDGAIVVCHDLYPETAAAMESAIRTLADRGYQLVTVSELLEARAGGGTAGKLYYAA